MVVEGSSERSLEAMLRAALAVAGFFWNLPALLIRLSAVQRPVGLFLLDGLARSGTGQWCWLDRVVRSQLSNSVTTHTSG